MMKGATSSGVKRPRSASASSQPTAGATKQPKTEKATVATAASTQKRPAARPPASQTAPTVATKPRVASSSAPATTQRKAVVTPSTAAVSSKPTTAAAAKTPAAVSTVAKKPATAAGKKAPPAHAPAGKSSASEKKKAAPIPTAESLAKVKTDKLTSENKVKKSSTPLISRFAVTTYHNVMVGYEVYDKALLAAASSTTSAEGAQSTAAPQLLITQSFIAKHHVGCVTCSACHDKTIISAGTDERLFIYKNAFSQQTGRCTTTVVGSTCPASEVVCAAFPNNKFLLCGCHDGTLGVYQTKDWDPTAVIEVHDSSLTDLAIHPSGALAITTGKDRYVAFVDTVRGNVVTRHRFSVLDGYPTAVRVSPDGKEVAVLTSHALHLIDASTAVVTARMTVERQPPFELQCLCYVKSVSTGDHVLVVGDESGRLLTPRKKTGEVSTSSSKSAAATVSTAVARAVPKKKAASTKAKVVTPKEDDEDEEDEEDEEHNSEEDEEEEANSSPKNNNKKQEPSDGGLELVQCGVVTDNEKRVRAMCLLGATSGGVGSGKLSKAEDAQRSFLVTCDPDGVVALWRCEEDKKKNKGLPSFTKVGEKATGARCTGLCAF